MESCYLRLTIRLPILRFAVHRLDWSAIITVGMRPKPPVIGSRGTANPEASILILNGNTTVTRGIATGVISSVDGAVTTRISVVTDLQADKSNTKYYTRDKWSTNKTKRCCGNMGLGCKMKGSKRK